MLGKPLPRHVLNNTLWGVLSTNQGEALFHCQWAEQWVECQQNFRDTVGLPPEGAGLSFQGARGAVVAAVGSQVCGHAV